MDSNKKFAKAKFLAPGMLGKSKERSKFSFGLPGYHSTVENIGSPAIAVSNVMPSAASLSQNHEGVNTSAYSILLNKPNSNMGMGQSPFVAAVVTTKPMKPKDGVDLEDKRSEDDMNGRLKDIFEAGYQIEDVIDALGPELGPELGKNIHPYLENFVPLIRKENPNIMHFIRQGGGSNEEEEDSVRVSENTSSHPVDTDIPIITKRKRTTADARPRGVNLCKRVSNLKPGSKLPVVIVNKVPIGDIGKEMVRHMDKLIRDPNIVPVRIHSWDDLEARDKEHLWQSLIDKFDSEDMDLQRDSLLAHMKRLWQNWRGLMKPDNINKKETIEDAMKDVPNHLTKEDWEWLVKHHYMSDEFKKLSARNSKNRGTEKIMHRTGSRPFQDIIWSDLGAKDGNQPLISEVFRRTRMRKSGTLDVEETRKYEEILEVEKDEGLSRFDVIQNCFGQQDHSHVVCFGQGIKPKDVRGPLASRKELTRSLRDKEKETSVLKKCLDEREESRKREHLFYDEKVKILEELMMEKSVEMEKRLQILMTMAIFQQSNTKVNFLIDFFSNLSLSWSYSA